MNRKAEQKTKRKVEKEEQIIASLAADKARAQSRVHPYDDTNTWLRGDFQKSPWSPEEMRAFQRKLDSAFGGDGAILLVWSGDRSYGDAFYTDWHENGLPKGKLEHKPLLLFAEQKINEHDYLYISVPRFLLVEAIHGSQLENGWEESAWVTDPYTTTGRKRIRAEKPPMFMYQHLRTIAEHDKTIVIGDTPRCCRNMLAQNRICYGRYRLPSDEDIAFVRGIRENMDKEGVAQRNDEERSQKVLQHGTLATQYYIRRAKEQQAQYTKEVMLANSEKFFGDLPAKIGTTKTHKELEAIYREALDQQDEERGL